MLLALGVALTGCAGLDTPVLVFGEGSTGAEVTPQTCAPGERWNSLVERCLPDAGQVVEDEASALVELSPTADCVVPEDVDFEGYFGPDEMDDYIGCLVPMVDAWIDVVYAEMPHPKAYYYVPVGVTGADEFGCAYDDTAAHYCITAETVYIGQAMSWTLYDGYGDASMALALGHEVSHHLQSTVGIYDAVLAVRTADNGWLVPQDEIVIENQADCGAGAFLAWLDRDLQALDPDDDLVDLGDTLVILGEAESDGRTHGTVQERLDAFNLAFTSTSAQPLEECNVFHPDVPLISF